MKNNKTIWLKDEIEFLNDNFSKMFNSEISKLLNRSELSIINKAHKLGLKKSKEHKSLCISKRNKMVGRDLNYDILKIIAKSYKSRSEFQKSDPSAYSRAKSMGILDDICSHMISKNFSIPQIILKKIISGLICEKILYNDRKIIKPYEIDIYLPDYKLGFEYNGKGWHLNNKNDLLKQEISKKNNITLIVIVENNRDYINDIKSQIINHINIINKIVKINLSPLDILNFKVENPYNDVYDIDDIISVTKKYNSFIDFYKNEQKIYSKIIKLGKIDELTSHMCCRRKKRNIDEVKDKISKYEFLLDLITYDKGTYLYVKKNKLDHLLCDLKSKRQPN